MESVDATDFALQIERVQNVEFQRAREVARLEFERQAGEKLVQLRGILSGLMAMLSFHLRMPIAEPNETISYEIALACSFNRTQLLVYALLSEGNVIEGATLLRRQVEVLSRILELQAQPLAKLRAKTPNIGTLLKRGTGKIYGELSQIAHFADPSGMDLLLVTRIADRVGPSPYPMHHDRAVAYFEVSLFLAVVFSSWLHGAISTWHPSVRLTNEEVVGAIAIETAYELGIYEKGTEGFA